MSASPPAASSNPIIERPAIPLAVPFAVACVGVAIFSGMDAVMKHLAIVMGSYNAMLWRTVSSMLLLGPIFLIARGRWPRRQVLILHLAKGLVHSISLLLFFWALARVPMALGIALTFVAPLLALGMAAVFLKEKVAGSAAGASFVAFAGVIVILVAQPAGAPGTGDWRGPAALLVAAFLYAIGTVIGRALAQRASPLEVALFFNIVAGGLFLSASPWLGVLPAPEHLPAIAAATLTSTGSIMLVAWAYARAEAQYLLPVEYTAFLWAALLGWWVFGEHVTNATLGGAVLIVGGCLWAARGGGKKESPVP
jgi:S-adenosylmethionine uptake transporter